MTRWGFCPDRLRLKWRCPLATAKKTDDLTSCPVFDNGCSGSPYGRDRWFFRLMWAAMGQRIDPGLTHAPDRLT